MNLVENWTLILKHAWSVRFMVLAGILSSLEALVPELFGHLPREAYATVLTAIITAATISRFIAQTSTRPQAEAPDEAER